MKGFGNSIRLSTPWPVLIDEHVLDLPEHLLDLLPIGVCVCDRNGQIVRYNRSAAVLWGREPGLGDSSERFCGCYRMLRLDGSPIARSDFPTAQVLASGIPVRDEEVVIERLDGSQIVVLVNIEALKDESGAIVGSVNCFRDVTDFRHLKKEVREAERRSGDLLEALPAAVYTTDASGRMTFYNKAAVELWGCRPELGKSEFCGSWNLFWPDGSPISHDERPMVIALKEKQAIAGGDAVAERPGGSRVPFTAYPTPLFDSAGNLTGAVNMLVDVSARKRAEDRMRDSEMRYRRIFDTARVSLWEEDLSAVMKFLGGIRGAGVTDLRAYLQAHPDQLQEAVRLVQIKDVNAFTVELFEADRKEAMLHSLGSVFVPETMPVFTDELVCLWNGGQHFESESVVQTLKGRRLHIKFTIAFEGGSMENTLVSVLDISAQKEADRAAQSLAAIVESSDDAILAVDLDGVITSWNRGAERLLGYTRQEAIGRPVTMLYPSGSDEETRILARIPKGERFVHYETLRQRKDGSFLNVSLTVSPIKDGRGRIVGASKIARDITERKRAQEQEYLLLREMSHRIKNLFTVAGSIVALSARGADTAEDLAQSVQDRLAALARAHELTLTKPSPEAPLQTQATTLHALIEKIVSPFENHRDGEAKRVRVTGPDIPVGAASVTAFALLLHEFATNAAKYGALSAEGGHIDVRCSEEGGLFNMIWQERGGPLVTEAAGTEGFGGLLVRITVTHQLGGAIERDWNPDGLAIRLAFDKTRLAD